MDMIYFISLLSVQISLTLDSCPTNNVKQFHSLENRPIGRCAIRSYSEIIQVSEEGEENE